MKVPYLAKKRREEMAQLANEFAQAISTNLEPDSLKSRLHTGWLNNLHSIFALLQILHNSRHTLNPSREYTLAGARISGNSNLFLNAMVAFQAPSAVSSAMQEAYSKTIFSGFIAELQSDLLMVFVHGLMYSYRNAAICLRCSLEDLYRHLYYMDHPQEYVALIEGRETEYSMNLSPQRFREYLKRVSYLKPFSTVKVDFSKKASSASDIEMDWFGENESIYGSLSAAVHGASEDWFAAIQNSTSLQINPDKEEKLGSLSSRFSKLCAAFLIAAHRDAFSSAGDYDKSIVVDLFSLEERKNIRQLLNI